MSRPTGKKRIEKLFGRDSHPGMHDDPIKWEVSWGRTLDEVWKGPTSKFGNPSARMTFNLPDEELETWDTDALWMELFDSAREIVNLQMTFGTVVVLKERVTSFEWLWRQLSDDGRAGIILDGIVRAMERDPEMHKDRLYCPESTFRNLVGQGSGENYLKYLRMILPDDIDRPFTEPKVIPNPVVDRFLTVEPDQARSELDLRIRKAHAASSAWSGAVPDFDYRNYFLHCCESTLRMLARRLIHTLCQFGEPLSGEVPRVVSKLPRERLARMKTFRPNMLQTLAAVSTHRRGLESINTSTNEVRNACVTCHKLEEKNKDSDVKFSACSVCRSIGRIVFYCSQACQADDWKNGVPRPHKHICGKPLNETMIYPPALPIAPQPTLADFETLPSNKQKLFDLLFPLPQPGFQRSPSLVYLICRLRDDLENVYEIRARINDGAAAGLMMPEGGRSRAEFLLARYKAFTTGEQAAVQELYNQVSTMVALSCRMEPELVREQFKEDFPGVAIEVFPKERLVQMLNESEFRWRPLMLPEHHR